MQTLDVSLHLQNLLDIEERWRRGLTIILPGHGMEDNWKFLRHEKRTTNEGVDSAPWPTGHQVTIVETIVGIVKNCVVRAVVFRELDHPVDNILVKPDEKD